MPTHDQVGTVSPGRLRQGLQSLQRRWQAIAGAEYDAETARLRPHLPLPDHPRLLEQMRRCLDPRGGEIRARARAAALGRAYLALEGEGRQVFLQLLAREFDLDLGEVEKALAAARHAGTPEEARITRQAILEACRSPRVRILTGFNALPQGVKFLVDLRADLLPLARRDPMLAALDDDLRALLAAWFDVDFLELRRISWETASGALLEKFMAYEAVHPVESWEDLKNRLDMDRRYFAFFHPRMPEEPLIFLEVALDRGMAGSIPELLDPSAPVLEPSLADTAVFYSISNAQRGLAGVSFGGFLIKRVVDALALELPRLKRFCTLSPLPGFRRWLQHRGREGEPLFLSQEEKKIRKALGADSLDAWTRRLAGKDPLPVDPPPPELRDPLLRLAAHYLAREKRNGGSALDPVAHFHLSNGARAERLNWMGDPSERGLDQSLGIMVNYLYDARKIEKNHESYRTSGSVAVAPSLKALLKG